MTDTEKIEMYDFIEKIVKERDLSKEKDMKVLIHAIKDLINQRIT